MESLNRNLDTEMYLTWVSADKTFHVLSEFCAHASHTCFYVSDFVQNWSVFEIGIWRYLLHGFFIYCMLNTTDQGSRVTRPDKFKNSPGSIYARIYTWLSETKNSSLVCCITAMSWFHELVAEFYEWMKTVSWLLPNSTWYDNNRLGFFFSWLYI